MKIFFIRHGETEHNVVQLLAGATDSRLTNHGVLQTQRLGAHFVDRGLRFTHIYASNLQRAYMTAQAVADAQAKRYNTPTLEIPRLPHLREQNFGSDELVAWNSKRGQDSFFNRTLAVQDPNFVPKETTDAMKKRAADFMNDFIIPLFATDDEEENTVAVVSHGLFLGVLWRDLLARFAPSSVTLSPSAAGDSFGGGFKPLEHVKIWANTAYLEVEIHRRSAPHGMDETLNAAADEPAQSSSAQSRLPALPDRTMVIKTINGREHTAGMVKTRGGLGNVAHDPKQKDIAGFFKKPAPEHENAVETGEVLERALETELEAERGQVLDPSPMGGFIQR